MSGQTKIEWTDRTWNPVVGCRKVSAGCDHCYAIRQAHRMAANPALPHYAGLTRITNRQPNWAGAARLVPGRLMDPFGWKKPQRVFVNSMSDLFHEDVPDDAITEIFAVMGKTQQHTYQVLTKRPERMKEFCDRLALVFPNIWLGVSVENQTTADERIPLLLEMPSVIRFVSAEPLLGPVDFSEFLDGFHGLDWVIIGAESGPGARPMNLDWARWPLRHCVAAQVPFFMKQICDSKGCKIPFEAWPDDLKVRQFPEPRP